MDFIFDDRNKRQIFDHEELHFTSFSAFHLITIAARTKDKRQISPDALHHESLTVEIDGKHYASSFQGNKLHNNLQTISIVTFLRGKDHMVRLVAGAKQKTATLEGLGVSVIDLAQTLTLTPHAQADDGNGRPWLTFILDTLSLVSFTSTITYSRRKRDSDDVKIIIDSTLQKNLFKTIKFLFWRLAGSLLPLKTSTKTETETFTVNLPKKIHTIAFEADRTPTFESIVFDFGTKPEPPIHSPTVDNPAWTGDFADDSQEILLARLIFGEAEDQSKETKMWIAGSILNRAKAQAWPNTIWEVILQPGQYDPFKPEDPNFPKITDPLNNTSEKRKESWYESYQVARDIISGTIANPTEATHFHGRGVSIEWFLENVVPNGKFIRQIDDTFFYLSPN